MRNLIDLTGQKFGRLTVLGREESQHSTTSWVCKCDCGKEKIVRSSSLRRGSTTSCGCYSMEVKRKSATKHGLSQSSEFSIWKQIVYRCTRKENKLFPYYGGRGISVCDRWLEFNNFYADMGQRPSNQHSIDRINNDGNYEPGNCRWATKFEQAINRRLRSTNISGCPGVTWKKRKNKWDSRITVHKKVIFLGEFDDLDDAIKARKEAESIYFRKPS